MMTKSPVKECLKFSAIITRIAHKIQTFPTAKSTPVFLRFVHFVKKTLILPGVKFWVSFAHPLTITLVLIKARILNSIFIIE